jgi:hypothetical protein
MLVEINGYKSIKTIYDKSKIDENASVFFLCEQILEVFENEYLDYIRSRIDEI